MRTVWVLEFTYRYTKEEVADLGKTLEDKYV